MEAAQLQPPQPAEAPAGALEAPRDEATQQAQGSAEEGQRAPEPPRLTAVPPEVLEEEPLPERAPRTAGPDEEEEPRPQRAPKAARKEKATAKEHPTTEGGPSRDMVRRFRERLEGAKTPEEKAEALKYGLERGVPQALELAAAVKAAAEAASPAASAQPAPPPAAEAAAGTQAAPGQAPAAPPEPTIYGHNRKALKTAAEKALAVANLCEGLGKMVGWDTTPTEPMTLFDDVPGIEPLVVTGNAKKELVELLSRELADFTKKAGGEADSPFKRRVQIGVLVVGVAGPGLVPMTSALVGKAMGMLKGVSQAVSGQVRRWRRRK